MNNNKIDAYIFFNYEWLGNEWHISDTGLFFMNAHIWTCRAKEFLEAWY